MNNPMIEDFKKERNEALLSLDENRIRDYMQKWDGNRGHPNSEIFMAGVRKAITGCKDLPLEFRREAKKWLTERGFQSLDDGDL